MVTSPGPHAIRSGRPAPEQVEGPNRSASGGGGIGIVVHLELPERRTATSGSTLPAAPAQPDLHLLARAMQDLVRAAAPSVITRVSVEPSPAPANGPAGSPRLRPVPAQTLASRPRACAPAPVPAAVPVGVWAGAPITAPVATPSATGARGPGAEPEGIDIDLFGRSLRLDGRPIELTRREFDLLAYLYSRRRVALSRRELMNAVWQSSHTSGDRTIDVHVRRVRAKLGRHAERLITLRGFGYRFD